MPPTCTVCSDVPKFWFQDTCLTGLEPSPQGNILCVCVKTPRNRVKWFLNWQLRDSWQVKKPRDVHVRPLSRLTSIKIHAGGASSTFSLAPTKTLKDAGDITADHRDVPAKLNCWQAVLFLCFTSSNFTSRFMSVEFSATFHFMSVEFSTTFRFRSDEFSTTFRFRSDGFSTTFRFRSDEVSTNLIQFP